jgi:hypothetical protein
VLLFARLKEGACRDTGRASIVAHGCLAKNTRREASLILIAMVRCH